MTETSKATAPTRQEAIESVLNKHKIYVVASFRHHFINWCEENYLPANHPNVRHVYKVAQLRVLHKVTLFLAYGWWKDKELERGVLDYCSMNGIHPETLPRALVISTVPA